MEDNKVSDDSARLGQRLKETREYLNFSQQAVAEKTGLPRTAISAIEYGKRKVDSLELAKLAKLYNHPISYFLEEPSPEDKTLSELRRAVGDLDDADRRELVRFAEFLKDYGKGGETKRVGLERDG